jgi:hypothetical protein
MMNIIFTLSKLFNNSWANLAILNMAMLGFIPFIKLFCQAKSYNIVMAHNDYNFIGFFILFEKGFHSISSSSKICCSLIDKCFFHVL